MLQLFQKDEVADGNQNGRKWKGGTGGVAALPLHIQRVEKALRLDPIFNHVKSLKLKSRKRGQDGDDDDDDGENYKAPHFFKKGTVDNKNNHSGVVVSKEERKSNRRSLYNLESLPSSRKWLENILQSDSLSEEDKDEDQDEEEGRKRDEFYVKMLLKEHIYSNKCQKKFAMLSSADQQKYMCYSSSLILDDNNFLDGRHLQASTTTNTSATTTSATTSAVVKLEKSKRSSKSNEGKDKTTLKPSKIKVEDDYDEPAPEPFFHNLFIKEEYNSDDNEEYTTTTTTTTTLTKRQQQLAHTNNHEALKNSDVKSKVKTKKPVNTEQLAAKRRKLWTAIVKKDIPRMHKHKLILRKDNLAGLRKVARECQRECRRVALASQKQSKESCTKARRLAKEMQAYWKRFEKVEKEHRKKAEKEALEQKKIDMEMKEMLRQQRKLNFLIAQTELYAHFMAGKLSGGASTLPSEARCEEILRRFDEDKLPNKLLSPANGRPIRRLDDGYDSQQMKELALNNVKSAIEIQKSKVREFDIEMRPTLPMPTDTAIGSAFSDPSINKVGEWKQPNIFRGTLKSYQLKGMNWIANLYDQGINGILADEMGLGKTVQSVAFLAHLAEEQGIWGPFLVVAPASTLHNWLQEMTKFVPGFKVIPYWGSTQDRKVLRKFWNKGNNKQYSDIPCKDSSFHVVITSYQMVVQDAKYFQQINWHYMVLDEAQAIKSSNSSRWKSLLVFKCRNRLLLTGTPIQNSMAELWALLHFIMPTLFDSHEEFSEWFSKDIESHVERQSSLDTSQLSRLHMILKPFMLRRVKKDVENELSDKIEIQVCCPLMRRQRLLYRAIKNKISIEDLLQSSSLSVSATNNLMNIVMQLRKVCNHPELFERREIKSPGFLQFEPYYMPKLIYREGWLDNLSVDHHHFLHNKLTIIDPYTVHQSLFHDCDEDGRTNSCYSFTRFMDLSPGEMCSIHKGGYVARWLYHLKCLKSYKLLHHQRHISKSYSTQKHSYTRFLVDLSHPASPQSLDCFSVLQNICFVKTCSDIYALCDHTIRFMRESFEHRKMRLKCSFNGVVNSVPDDSSPPTLFPSSPTGDEDSYPDSQLKSTRDYDDLPDSPLNGEALKRRPYKRFLVPTSFPNFLMCLTPKVICRGMSDHYTCDRSAEWSHRRTFDPSYNRLSLDCLAFGSPEVKGEMVAWRSNVIFSRAPDIGGFFGSVPRPLGYSGIYLPNKEMLVSDAGKLSVLDGLLMRLKSENHRVLIYSQMTKMINILEEFLWYRRHTYMRLDGSSKISDRRDMVSDFQTRSDIFIFLLSTRAGGLGINLTAADTVIFYDSDWNPTVDQQAMDRAHRLGQTKQVTVYRLVCKDTIEERILQRAKEKSEIQRMVISGGEFAPEILKPKEVVSLLLDDEEMARRLCQKQEQRRARDQLRRETSILDCGKRPKSKSGRGPGRPPKRLCMENRDETQNILVESPAIIIGTSSSYPPSPKSEKSGFSVATIRSDNIVDDDSNSNPQLVVDDLDPQQSGLQQIKLPRKRGRPKGSTSSTPLNSTTSSGSIQSRPRGRGSIQKSLSAAEAAALTAAKQAAFAAHGYTYSVEKQPTSSSLS